MAGRARGHAGFPLPHFHPHRGLRCLVQRVPQQAGPRCVGSQLLSELWPLLSPFPPSATPTFAAPAQRGQGQGIILIQNRQGPHIALLTSHLQNGGGPSKRTPIPNVFQMGFPLTSHPFIHSPLYPSICLSLHHPSIPLSVHPPTHPSITHPPIRPSPSPPLPAHPLIHIPARQLVHVPISLTFPSPQVFRPRKPGGAAC